MEGATILFAILTIFFIILFKILMPSKRPKNFPPGPPRIPLLGNALSLGPDGYKITKELSKTYGNIIGLQMGSYWTVVLTNLDDIREAFNKPEFSGRYGFNGLLDQNNDGKTNMGVILSSGKTWLDLRRFSLKTLRDHGFGKRSMESIIQEECHDLIQEFKKDVGKPITTQNRFNAAVLNVVWAIISGNRYAHDDPKLAELNQLLSDVIQGALKGIRFLNFMFPKFVDFRKRFPALFYDSEAYRNKLFDLLHKTIQEHRDTITLGSPRDFIDTYLEEALKHTHDKDTSFKLDDDYFGLSVLLADFFAAGSETTSTTTTWAFFFLAMNPDKQRLLYQEIQRVVGNRVVGLEDRINLPYVEATMAEILRMSSLVAMDVPHATTEDVVFKGYDIPKNTLVFANIHAVHYSESWGDPTAFRPERFLSDDLQTFNRANKVITFSIGKRQCLGESLARDNFFVFLTNLVQEFEITFPADEPPHTMCEPRASLILTPEAHRIVLLNRNN